MTAIPNLGRFVAFATIGTVALMPLLVLPAMVGVLVDRAGLSEPMAGWSASLHFLGSAAIGVLMSLRMHHLSLRRVATIALVLAVVSDLASAWFAGPNTAFLVARTIAGIALGAAYVCAVSSFARYDNYERGFGLYITLQFTVSGLGLYVVPVFSADLGGQGLFVAFAGLDLLALSLVRFLPEAVPARKSEIAVENVSELRVLLTAAAITAIFGFALFEAANNAQFTYIERFGVALALSEHQIGVALLVASLIGIPGAFVIVVVGQRFGTLPPLTLGIGTAVAGLLLLITSDTYVDYFIGSCFMGFSWAFCLPFIQSLLASLDRKGSAIAAGTSLSTLGSAVGPGLAALVVDGGRYANVFYLSIGIFVLTYLCLFYAARHRDQTRTVANA